MACDKKIKMQKGIKNIVFDLGGVLVGLDKDRCVNAFYKVGLKDIAYYVDECRQEDLFHELELGSIGITEFCDEVRRRTDCDVSDEQICWAWNQLLTDMPAMKIEKLLSLHDRYRIFLLSNTNPIHWHKCMDDFFPYKEWSTDDYFEQVFLSYKMHKVKPDDEIFMQMMKEGKMKPQETLFVDDSKVNCEAARKLQIKTLNVKANSDWTEIIDSIL